MVESLQIMRTKCEQPMRLKVTSPESDVEVLGDEVEELVVALGDEGCAQHVRVMVDGPCG